VEKLEREASEKLQAIAGVVAVEGAQAMLRNALDSTTTSNGEPAAPVHVSIVVGEVTHTYLVHYTLAWHL
jgi:hypothetical protein